MIFHIFKSFSFHTWQEYHNVKVLAGINP